VVHGTGRPDRCGGYAGPYRGLGIPNRPTRGQAAATAQGACAHARRVYRPRRCGLCHHERVFDTRTSLNNHASRQHGYYYSLKGDCFTPLGRGGAGRNGPPSTAHGCCDFEPRLRGRARRVPGRARPSYPRSVPSVRYPQGSDCPFPASQAVRSGVVTAWLPPQFPVLGVEAEVGPPTTPPPPAVPGPSPPSPPEEAALQMALSDFVEPEVDAVDPAATTEPPMMPPETSHNFRKQIWSTV